MEFACLDACQQVERTGVSECDSTLVASTSETTHAIPGHQFHVSLVSKLDGMPCVSPRCPWSSFPPSPSTMKLIPNRTAGTSDSPTGGLYKGRRPQVTSFSSTRMATRTLVRPRKDITSVPKHILPY